MAQKSKRITIMHYTEKISSDNALMYYKSLINKRIAEPNTSITKAEIIDSSKNKEWDKLVVEHPYGTIFHHTSFQKVIENTFPHVKPYRIALIDRQGKVKTGMAVFLIQSLLTGKRLVSIPFAYYGDPLISSKEEFELLLEKTLDIFKKEKASYLEIKSRYSNAMLADVRKLVPVFNHKIHHINITAGIDEIWSKLDRSCIRQKIQRAEKTGLKIRKASSESDIVSFWKLMVITRKRLGLPPQNCNFFKNIWKYIGNEKFAEFLLAENNGELIGGLNIFKFKDTVVLGHLASNAGFRNAGIDQYLLWKAIETGKSEGYNIIDMGKTSACSSSLAAYKRRWGAVELDAPSYYYPALRGIAAHNNENKKSYKLMSFIWRNIPMRFAGLTGRFVYKHMG